jgi:hypothetical protein
MKRTYKNLFSFALAGLLTMSLAFTADAQRRAAGGGGGGGGSRPSGGGGGGSISRPSGGGGGGFSRPSGGGGSGIAPSRQSSGGGAIISRGNQSVAPQRVDGGNGRPAASTAPQRGSYGRPDVVNTAPQRGGGNAVRSYGGTTRYNSIDRRSYNGGRGTYYRGGGNYGYGRRVSGYSGRYGGRGGYFGSHYYYQNRGYYNSYYLPRLGFSIGYLPYGYYPFYFGDYQYYYSDGLYYQQQNNQYTVVEPPVGAEIKSLPSDAQSITINGEQYYESNGVYYQSITKDDGTQAYVIAGKDGELNTDQGNGNGNYDQGPQIGDVANQLPQDCRKIKINGEKLYVSPDGFYYQEITDNDGNVSYKVVGTPSDEPDGQN